MPRPVVPWPAGCCSTNGCRLMPLRSRPPCSHPWPAAVFLAMFAAPANLLAFLPKFYFGGLTAWIGQDILKVCSAVGRAGGH